MKEDYSDVKAKLEVKEMELKNLRWNYEKLDKKFHETSDETLRLKKDFLAWEKMKVDQTELLSNTLLGKEELELVNRKQTIELKDYHKLVQNLQNESEDKGIQIDALVGACLYSFKFHISNAR